jgi:hypothetical protein
LPLNLALLLIQRFAPRLQSCHLRNQVVRTVQVGLLLIPAGMS